MKPNRYWTSKRRKNRRKRLRKDHGENCHWCGVAMEFDNVKSPQSATVDHLVPVSRGGSNRVKNTVLACRACNNARGDMPWKVWVRAVRRSAAYIKPTKS